MKMKIMKTNIKLIILLTIIISFLNCSKEVEEMEKPLIFSEGLFIANNSDISSNSVSNINFYKLGNENDFNQFNHSDLYSSVNNEKIDGVLIDMVIHNSNTFLLISGTNTQIIVLDKLTMKKKSSITLNINSPRKFLVNNKTAYVSNFDAIYAVDLENEEIIKEFNENIDHGGVGEMIIHNNNLYYASQLPYGRINQINLNQNIYVKAYNVGPYPNSFLFLEDNTLLMTAERAANRYTSAYTTSEFLNTIAKSGLLKLNTETNTITQIIESDFAYPKHLSRDGNLFCFIEFEGKFHPFDSNIRIWDKSTNTLSSQYKINFFGGNNNGYSGMTSLKLKNSLLYATVKNGFYLLDIESSGFIRASAKEDTVKLIFTEE